jgi:ADP-ribose pyrophosphatase YjhB (NUDIX family)
MKQHPSIAVKLVLLCGRKILMLRHQNGALDFPGGRMEWGESPSGALKRELTEELGYSLPKEPRFFDIWNYISKDKKRHSVFLYYFQIVRRKPELQSTENAKILWLSKQELKPIIKDISFLKKLFSLKPQK